jgi:hypothetical protein
MRRLLLSETTRFECGAARGTACRLRASVNPPTPQRWPLGCCDVASPTAHLDST